MGHTISCNFCGKSREKVFKLIASDNIAICNECVEICSAALQKERQKTLKVDEKYDNHINPIKIKNYLDKFVVGQEDAKIGISVSVANHYKRILYESPIELDKSNVLILGPSGSGKTFLIKNVAKFLNVPFAQADATSFTEAGYVGDDVETVISRLVQAANGDIEQAEQGIVFIDEIDKITRKSSGESKDIGGSGVQAALLKMVEGSIVKVPVNGQRKHPSSATVEVDTKNILFIVGGAFVGFDDIIDARLKKKNMGFGHSSHTAKKSTYHSREYLPDDFVKYGLIPEFIGRFPLILNTLDLTKQQLVQILRDTENNLLDQYKHYFSIDNVELEFTDDCIEAIATKAFERKIGARGLKNILDHILMIHHFKLPDYKDNSITKIIFAADQVSDDSILPTMIIDGLNKEIIDK
jgi:ATP-dependent Clp protease ATP-binding subunit ClpX